MDVKSSNKSIMGWINNLIVSTTLSSASAKNVMIYQHSIDYMNETKINLVCESGTISTDYRFTQFGIVPISRLAMNINNDYDVTCTNFEAFAYSIRDCEGEKSCHTFFKPYWFKEGDCQKKYNQTDKTLGIVKIYCQGRKLVSTIFFF